jgi:hypothetical protein
VTPILRRFYFSNPNQHSYVADKYGEQNTALDALHSHPSRKALLGGQKEQEEKEHRNFPLDSGGRSINDNRGLEIELRES